jgi:hypothetical protein
MVVSTATWIVFLTVMVPRQSKVTRPPALTACRKLDSSQEVTTVSALASGAKQDSSATSNTLMISPLPPKQKLRPKKTSRVFTILLLRFRAGIITQQDAIILTGSWNFLEYGWHFSVSRIAVPLFSTILMALAALLAQARGGGFTQPEPIAFDDHEAWVQIFDGASLKNWDGKLHIWRLENGAIVDECNSPAWLS